MLEKVVLLVDGRPEQFIKEEFELAKMVVEEVESVKNIQSLLKAVQLLEELGVPKYRCRMLVVVAKKELSKGAALL